MENGGAVNNRDAELTRAVKDEESSPSSAVVLNRAGRPPTHFLRVRDLLHLRHLTFATSFRSPRCGNELK